MTAKIILFALYCSEQCILHSMKNIRNERKKYTSEQKKTVLTAIITAFITTFMGSALNLSIPAISKEFGVSAQEVGWVVTVYMLTCAALAVSFGKAADRIDRSMILKIGILIFMGASLVAAFSQSMWVLLVFRFVQGVGASMIFATNIALLVSVFDKAESGKVLGYATCATYVGLSLGPVLGGILNEHLGWRAVFAAAAAVSAAAFVTAALNRRRKNIAKTDGGKTAKNFTEMAVCGNELSEADTAANCDSKSNNSSDRRAADKKFDWKGSVLFTAAISSVMYALSAFKTSRYAPFLLAGGLILFAVFVRAEKRAEDPLINVELFRKNLSYTFANFAAMLNYGAIFAVSYLISVYLQVIKGFSSQNSGFVLLASTAVIAVFSPLFGKVSDKFSPQRMSALGTGICAAALAGLIFITQETKLSIVVILLALSGFGFSLFSSPNTNAVMGSVSKEDYGTASAVLAAMRSGGHSVSMAIITLIMGIFMDGSSLYDAEPNVIIKVMQTGFIVFTIFCILGIFMARYRKI